MKSDYQTIVKENKIFFNKIAAFYMDIYPLQEQSSKRLCRHLQSSFFGGKNSSVLDLGCGTGILLNSLKENFSDVECFGLDISENMINIAKKIATKRNNNISYITGNWFKDNNYPCKDFDMILCCGNSISHYPKESYQYLFKTVYSHLKNGGKLIIDTYKNWKAFLKQTEVRSRGLILSRKKICCAYFLDIPYKKAYLERRIFLFEYELRNNIAGAADKIITHTIYHYPMSIVEIKKLLIYAGFKKVRTFEMAPSDQLMYLMAKK